VVAPAPAPSDDNGRVSPAQGASDVSAVASEVTPSVVNVDIRTTPDNSPFSFGQEQQGTGSGVIYSADGYIITNNHVVANAQEIKVTLASGTSLSAEMVGADPENDIAVIKVDGSDLPAIAVGNSDNLVVGQLVVAVGSPLGFEQTVTAGIVSALHRVVSAPGPTGATQVLSDLIQTDAPINPGNSGGALCDSNARLIGINTLIASQSGGSQGLGFAIPVNTAKQVADNLIAGKPISHPYIGILGQTISPSIATQYNLPVEEGAYVTGVVPGSPAEKAGMATGDIITGIDGKPVTSMDDVIASVRGKQVGEQISVDYFSGGSKKTAELTLAEKPTTLPEQ
jgi:S1-C subfamily serine protease